MLFILIVIVWPTEEDFFLSQLFFFLDKIFWLNLATQQNLMYNPAGTWNLKLQLHPKKKFSQNNLYYWVVIVLK